MLQGGKLHGAHCPPFSNVEKKLDCCCLRAGLRLVSHLHCLSTARRPRWHGRTLQDREPCCRTAYRRTAGDCCVSASVTRHVFAPPRRLPGAPLSNFSSPFLHPSTVFQVLGAFRLFLVT